MKLSQRILLAVVVLALVLSCALGMAACNQKEPLKDTEVVITVDPNVMSDIAGKTLADYMAAMKEKKLLSYEASTGDYGLFITSVNGREADSTKEYWALFTDDSEFSNEAWGTYETNGKTYAMASVGVSSMMLKTGKSYVLVIQPLS